MHGFAITSYLLTSSSSEAAIGRKHVVQLMPRGAHGAGTLTSAGRAPEQAWGPSDGVGVRPRGSCKAIHDAEFGVGDSYHVVGSERDNSTAQRRLAGNGMLWFPAIAAEPRSGSGTMIAPNSGDDTALRGGPPPRPTGPIKVRVEPSISLCPASPPAQAAVLRLRIVQEQGPEKNEIVQHSLHKRFDLTEW